MIMPFPTRSGLFEFQVDRFGGVDLSQDALTRDDLAQVAAFGLPAPRAPLES